MIDVLMGEGAVKREFPGKYILFKRFGIDISKEPMLVYPTLHYQNGGLEYNNRCETSVPGFFSAGEVSGGVHGENRLMGNSLLDVCVFGRIAGISAAALCQRRIQRTGNLTLDHVRRYHKAVRGSGNRHRSCRSHASSRLLQSQSPGAPTDRPLRRYDKLSFAMFFHGK